MFSLIQSKASQIWQAISYKKYINVLIEDLKKINFDEQEVAEEIKKQDQVQKLEEEPNISNTPEKQSVKSSVHYSFLKKFMANIHERQIQATHDLSKQFLSYQIQEDQPVTRTIQAPAPSNKWNNIYSLNKFVQKIKVKQVSAFEEFQETVAKLELEIEDYTKPAEKEQNPVNKWENQFMSNQEETKVLQEPQIIFFKNFRDQDLKLQSFPSEQYQKSKNLRNDEKDEINFQSNYSSESKKSRRKSSEEEINLELTFKTKNSKHFMSTQNRNDSLTYSNATSFGIQAHSPEKQDRNYSTNLKRQSQSGKAILNKIEDFQEDQDIKADRAVSREYEEKSSKESAIDLMEQENQFQAKEDNFKQLKNKLQIEDQPKNVENQNFKKKQFVEKISLTREVKSSVNLHEQVDHQKKRLETENNVMIRAKINSEKFALIGRQSQDSNIFQTEISDYKTKITKLREAKEFKKKKLQFELNKVNKELESIKKKEIEISSQTNSQANDYESRVKISDDTHANVKAERFIKNLRSQKRNRQHMKIEEIVQIDQNINNYMQELMVDRYKNEERIKQKKKLEIIQRMKQQELRKISEQKKKQETVHFVQALKHHGSVSRPKDREVSDQKRSPVKKSEHTQEINQLTPSLSRKKAYLSKLRNFSIKQNKIDTYEQVLS